MANTKFRVGILVTIGIIMMVLSHIFTIGYGTGFQSRGRAMLALQQAKQHSQSYTPSLLTVHYERQNGTAEDILRLEIDTTYRPIGKNAFTYEMICDRKLALQSSSGESFTTDEARLCFVEGTKREWIKLEGKQVINGYDCMTAVALDNGRSWQAWYTTQLPHCSENATIADGLNGLIMMARDSKDEWSLKATNIDVKLG